jgi:hypothetical protein
VYRWAYNQLKKQREKVKDELITFVGERFEDMRFMKRCREIEFVKFSRHVFKKLTKENIEWS